MTAKEQLKNMNIGEKARLLTGVGSWHTSDAGGRTRALFMSDGPHGLRVQDMEEYADINNSHAATAFPTGSCLAAGWNPDNASALGAALAAEASAEKVDIVLGPAVNIQRSPLCGRNFEYYSEDPYLAGTLGAAYVNAMESHGVMSCVKHFAANSREKQRQTTNSVVDERTLREIYLRAFEIIVREAHPSTIMGAYNRLNGEYCCRNRRLLLDILRDEWGFDGAVISDWGATMDITECIKNGMDLEMPDSYGFHTEKLIADLESGTISEKDIDRAAAGILRTAEKTCVKTDETPDIAAQNDIAKKIAEDCAVLLKTEGVLSVGKEENVLLIGKLAVNMRFQGGGSSHITARENDNVYALLSENGYRVTYAENVPENLDEYDKILFFCGLTDKLESEGYDRTSYDLPKDQLEAAERIFSSGKPAAAITFGGAPFAIPFADKAGDILHMHLCGQAVGEAAYDLITGRAVPCGHLAQTWPLRAEDSPSYGSFSEDSEEMVYDEGLFCGYRYFETYNKPVRFEFGRGLSYTTFEYGDYSINIEDNEVVNISFSVKNTGNLNGAETAQIYVRNEQSVPGTGIIKNPDGTVIKLERAAVELKGYRKVYLKAGEKKTVNITLGGDAFSLYDVNSEAFRIAGGSYEICVGSSVKDIRLKSTVEITGETIAYSDRVWKSWKNDKNSAEINGIKGRYTIYDSLQDVCAASLFGRLLLKAVTAALRISCKAGPDDPAYLMVVIGMKESPLDSLIATSNGLVKPNLTESLVLFANGHPFRGFGRLFKHSKAKKR